MYLNWLRLCPTCILKWFGDLLEGEMLGLHGFLVGFRQVWN